MTSNKPAEGTKPRKEKKKKKNMEDEKKKKKKKKLQTKNKINNSKSKTDTPKKRSNNDDKPEILIVPSSSPESQNDDREGEDEEVKISDITNQRSNTAKEDAKKKAKKDKTRNAKKDKSGSGKNSEDSLYSFPMNRIHRIIKSDDSDIRVTQEAIYLINKASEKFLELFCKEAYAASVQDHKKFVGYQHLSSVVSKRRRLDFLSDFVPEKVKAEDALAEVVPADET